MTGQATLSATGGVVIERLGISNLSPLRHSGAHLMTFVASHLAVLCVTETDAKRLHELRRARVAAELVTRAAGRDVAARGLRARSVTAITGRVRVKAGRNRHCDAAARRAVTGCATDVAQIHVPRVIELHAKAAQAWERLERAGLHIGVANRADRTVSTLKLLRMTAGAGKVLRSSRPSRHRRI